MVFSGHAKLDLRCGILLGFSKPKFGIIFKPHKSHVGDLAPPLVCGGGDRRRLGREVKEKGKWGKDKQR